MYLEHLEKNLDRLEKNFDRRGKDLDGLIFPHVDRELPPCTLRLVLTEVNYFLSKPETEEMIWQLVKKFVLKK